MICGIGSAAAQSTDRLPGIFLRLAIRRRTHIRPGIGYGVKEPNRRFLKPHTATPLEAVSQRTARETDEAAASDIEHVRAIHAADAWRRSRRKMLLPFAAGQIAGKCVKPLGNSVMAGMMNP